MPPIDALLTVVLTIVALVIVILTRVLAILAWVLTILAMVLAVLTRVLAVLAWVALVRVSQAGSALPRRVLRDRGGGSVSTGAN